MDGVKKQNRVRRHQRIRARVGGIAERPRLSVFRSNRHFWVQLIDDQTGRTLMAASDLELKDSTKKIKKDRLALAGKVGEVIAQKAIDKKVKSVVFDRGGYKYHGVVKAMAEGARKGGLKF